MKLSFSRRAGANLFNSIAESSCKSVPRRPFAPYQTRPLTSTTKWRESSAPSAQATANAQQVQNELSPSDESEPVRSLTEGLEDPPPLLSEDERQVDWTRSFHGLSSSPFTKEQSEILQKRLDFDDIEIKPDGIVYLPEIKYRRILNHAFGPGGWGLAPRGETIVTQKVVTREYGLVCGGRLVSIARGEQHYFDPDGIPTATEGCKSNALMRCCKDLGIASELWDPRFIKKFMAEMGKEVMVEHMATKKRRKHYMRKDDELKYPWKDVSTATTNTGDAARSPGTGSVAKQAGDAAKKTFATARSAAPTSTASTSSSRPTSTPSTAAKK
ncbi:Mitochondrial genome maintenance [Lecanosticta acicola]|uniref:Mitochondrial genome maintenance protein MGM101 n=1 Tax=Lecanosticta acicola TaxID=111012 RepID=A0AAI8YVD4_9PEZI|nr:Mitochondrial genome maintenance [Lecanosticta acicola]